MGESISILLIFAIFLFFLIGMNVYRANKHKTEAEALIKSLEKGDKVKTYSGLFGTIVEIKEIKEDDILKERIAVLDLGNGVIINVDARSVFEKNNDLKI